MVMLPHLEECIKILFVNVNRCSVSLVSLHLMASVQAQKCSEETLVKAEQLLLHCQSRAPGCLRVAWRKLCFYKLEVFRDEKNPVVHSFFYFYLQTREMKFHDWKARLASQRFSKESQPSVSSFHCFSMLCVQWRGWSANPKKPQLALHCNTMSCNVLLCCTV